MAFQNLKCDAENICERHQLPPNDICHGNKRFQFWVVCIYLKSQLEKESTGKSFKLNIVSTNPKFHIELLYSSTLLTIFTY